MYGLGRGHYCTLVVGYVFGVLSMYLQLIPTSVPPRHFSELQLDAGDQDGQSLVNQSDIRRKTLKTQVGESPYFAFQNLHG